MATKQRTIETDLNLLARTLPSRFSQPILDLVGSLDPIFKSLPTVLTHGDFFEMNILVDARSGHLTGVIDWAEAEVLPFGFGLGALENFLGYMDKQGWNYFDQHEDLKALFWNAFYADVGEDVRVLQSTIDLAARVSILLRRGFRWDEKMQRRVVEEGNSGVRYLDALFL